MIYGVTVNQDGTPVQRLTVAAKVSIGMPATDGKNYPSKLDHFRVTAKNSVGEWVDDPVFTEKLKEAMPMVEMPDGTKRRKNLTDLEIVLLSNDLEEVHKTEYAWWSKSEKKCSGNGREANRSVTALTAQEKKDINPDSGTRTVPWKNCGDKCPQMIDGSCKPSGALYFIFKERPIMGSVAAYYTTSYETIRRIQSSLLQIMDITGGRLKGIPLKMVLRPGKTRYEQDGKAKSGTAFFVNIEFRQEDFAKLIPVLIQQSVQFEAAVLGAKQIRRLPEHVEDDSFVIDSGTEESLAHDMTSEFYPENRGAEQSQPADLGKITELAGAMNLTAAHVQSLLGRHKGDIAAATEWLEKFRTAAQSIEGASLTQLFVDNVFTDAIFNKKEDVQQPATASARKTRATKAKAEPTPPAATSPAAPPAEEAKAAPSGEGSGIPAAFNF